MAGGLRTFPNRYEAPQWLKDFVGGRDGLVQFPAKLNVDAFPDMGGVRIVLSAGASAGNNEKQTLTLANATGGTFTVSYGGNTSAAVAYNVAASDLQTALEAIMGAGNIIVSGSAGGPYTLEFVNALGYQNVAQVTANGGSLTGSSPTITPATSVGGAAGASGLSVASLGAFVPKGTQLLFSNGATAKVLADTSAGASSIPIERLTATVVPGEYSQYNQSRKKVILGGTFCGRTIAERNSNTPFGPWTAGDDEEYLSVFTLEDANNYDDVEFLQHNKTIAENYLPNYASLSTAALARIRQLYQCINGFGG